MSSVHIHLHIQPSCHAHGQARHEAQDKGLRQGIAAMIMLDLLERLMQAAAQGGAAGHCHGHGAKPPALEGGHQAGQASAVRPGGPDGAGANGVVQQFMVLLILLALLCGHKGKHGPAERTADDFASRLSDRLAEKAAASPADDEIGAAGSGAAAPELPGADEAAPDDEGVPFEDPVSMMLGAMREGRAESLMAGQDDAEYERSLQNAAADLRQQMSAG